MLFIDFSTLFDSLHRGKIIIMLYSNGIYLEIVNEIMMLYQQTTSMDGSPNIDT